MNTRVLLLTFYYPPDLSAGSFRSESLTRALIDEGGGQLSVDVITTAPNRYASYQPASEANEITGNNLRIIRIELPIHQSGLLDQTWAYRRYAAGVMRATRNQEYDLVIATSSRLMTALLGAVVARRLRARLYLDIRDVFSELMPELTRQPLRALIAPLLSWCERWAINQSDQVNLVSPGFESWFRQRYPEKHFSFYTNGIDAAFISTDSDAPAPGPSNSQLTIVYAGNIGQGQGLHHIIPELARRLQGRAVFRIIGAGGQLDKLRQASAGLANIELIAPVGRTEILKAYRAADVLFLHLNDQRALHRVLPSKLFEYAASGKPIWAGVSGYAADFISREIDNAVAFSPRDADQAIEVFDSLRIGTRQRKDFISRYSRDRIMRQMARDIIDLARAERVQDR